MKRTLIILCFSITLFTKATNIDSLVAVLKSNIDDTTRLNTLNNISNTYQFIGNLIEASKYHKQMLELALKTNNYRAIGNYYNYEGRMFFYKQAYDSAISSFKTSLGYFEKINYMKGIISSRNNIAVIYLEKGEVKKSLSEHRQLVTINKKMSDGGGVASAYSNMGSCFMGISAMDSAIYYITKASRLNEELKLYGSLATNYYNLASINANIKQYNKALFYLHEISAKNLPLKQSLKNVIYAIMAKIYTSTNKIDSATYYVEKAISSSRSSEDNLSLVAALFNKADILKLKKNQAGQKKCLEEAIKISKDIEANSLLARAYSIYGDFLNSEENFNEAIKFYKLSNELFTENGNPPDIIYNIKGLAFANSRMGNFKESSFYLDSLIRYKGHLNEEAVLETLKEIEAKYESEKKDLQIQNANPKISLEEEKNRQKTTVIWIGSFALLITVFFGIIAFVSFKRSKKANKMIEAQKQTIEEKQTEVLASIRYAKRIQQSLMPTEKYIARHLNHDGE